MAHIKPLIQLKVKTYGRFIVLKANKIYFTGVEQELDLIAVNWSIFLTKLVK